MLLLFLKIWRYTISLPLIVKFWRPSRSQKWSTSKSRIEFSAFETLSRKLNDLSKMGGIKKCLILKLMGYRKSEKCFQCVHFSGTFGLFVLCSLFFAIQISGRANFPSNLCHGTFPRRQRHFVGWNRFNIYWSMRKLFLQFRRKSWYWKMNIHHRCRMLTRKYALRPPHRHRRH